MSEWISVEDQSPKSDEDVVLVICLHDISDEAYPYKPEEAMMTAFYCGGHWYLESWPEAAAEDNIIADVTHWMPLPQPPKEGDSNE